MIICLHIISSWAIAQRFSAQALVQKTIMGVQTGYGLRWQAHSDWGAGVLLQSVGKPSLEAQNGNYPFYGIEALVPLASCGKMSFLLSPKAGFVNENYFLLIPEVETTILLHKVVSIAFTAGLRARESAIGSKVLIHF